MTVPRKDPLADTRVSVIGGTGFIGGRLALALLRAGSKVTTASRARRSPAGLPHVSCDLVSGEGIDRALEGADVAYFLVHSMAGGQQFAERERVAAEQFSAAARRQKVGRVVYLGGLYPSGQALSEHLESRRRVGLTLIERTGALAVRAGVVVGAGSDSFEIIHGLAARLPAMIAPRWLKSRCQPIGVDDAIQALVAAPTVAGAREVDLAGPDVLTYRAMLLTVARIT
ncbi:MAG: NAD-dependent epimerase/dehydratase family protein, partial [Candidatus Dormiibacterota bacterium]